MRHLKKNKKLGRTPAHKKAMLKNMATSLLMSERIETTLPKAKVLRTFIEPLITRAKKANGATETEKILHQKRQVLKYIKDRDAIVKLFEDIALRYMNREGGYTRIYKLGTRKGDNAEMALIELVEEMLDAPKAKVKKDTKQTKSKVGKVETKKVEKTLEKKEEVKEEQNTEESN
jgi:large subunit ribosomal protein L17